MDQFHSIMQWVIFYITDLNEAKIINFKNFLSVFILIYIVYLITVILGRFINQKLKKKKEEKKLEDVDKSRSEFQFSKKYETNKISHHSSSMQHQTGRSLGIDVEGNQVMINATDLNSNTIQNLEQSNSNLKSVLITNTVNNKFGIDNPGLGKIFLFLLY